MPYNAVDSEFKTEGALRLKTSVQVH